MRKFMLILIIQLAIVACNRENVNALLVSQIIADESSLFYKFNRISGHLASLAFDKNDNLYVADVGNNVILKISSNGSIEHYAGNGLYAHVDGYKNTASFLGPQGLCFDDADNLYVTETNYIRKITFEGTVSTIAGSPVSGNLPNQKYRDGLALYSRFSNVAFIAIDSTNNLYVTDSDNSCIRKIFKTGLVSTLAGDNQVGYKNGPSNTSRFNYPTGISIGKENKIYVSDWNNNSIRKIYNNVVDTYAGNGDSGFQDGYGKTAKFTSPGGLASDEDETLYIIDVGNQSIRRISRDGRVSKLNLDTNGLVFSSTSGIIVHKQFLYVTTTNSILKIPLLK